MVTIEKVELAGRLSGLMRSQLEKQTFNTCVTESMSVYQGVINSQVACVWGIVPPTIMSTQAYIWLYTTDVADEHTFLLVRYSQRIVEELLKEFHTLTGHCRVDDERAIRWMRWLGAEFRDYQGQLVPFAIRRKNG